VTLSLDCKGATGWNGYSINTNADPAFYACGHDYALILSGGMVNSVCVSYYTIATFSLKNRTGLTPTIHGRAVDVTTGGAVGLDWANLEGSNASNFLSCTSVFSAQTVCNAVNAIPNFTEQGIACTVWNSVQANYDTCGTFGVLLDCQTSKILDQPVAEPAGVFAWASATPKAILSWLGAISSNCVRQTTTQQLLRTRADSATLATAEITCETSTVHRGSFT
jgi:hypothetical protein